MFKCLYNYLDKYSLLYSSQYGFRPNHSTVDAIAEFVNDICCAFENKKLCLGTFLDLSKAFDTIDYDILLYKLDWYGIRGKALEWFKSYLSSRKQYTEYKGTKSDEHVLTHGVPQGSVLGPLLFLLYVNDLPNFINKGRCILFADDTNILHSSTNVHQLFAEANSELNKIYEWFNSNKLSLNLSKTVCIVFSKNKVHIPKDFRIMIGECSIVIKNSIKFLGITVDAQLNWHDHINNTISKVNSSLYAINRVKNILPGRCLKTLYFSLVHSHLQYGIALWGGTHSEYVNKIFIRQKKAIRIISKSKLDAHTSSLFKVHKILKVRDLYELEVAKYVHRLKNNKLPLPLNTLFTTNITHHNYQTRNRYNPCVPLNKSQAAYRSLAHMGPVIWNSVPKNVQNLRNLYSFKFKFKMNLLERYSE